MNHENVTFVRPKLHMETYHLGNTMANKYTILNARANTRFHFSLCESTNQSGGETWHIVRTLHLFCDHSTRRLQLRLMQPV
ncbi:hypothetical protein HanRHA438_Chr09g0386191 [Helianthus annuus]|nr:hypothetical protein HanIR_Chr09g0403671 [Helianthus annuus]KAJ0887035.1 hypothetical protein HanRHA438_Chr09g0386191 [Helianthus annuus]